LGSSGVGGVGGGRKEGRGEMGHNVSKHAGGSKSGGGHLREEQFSGVALIQLISAQLQLKGKWFACVAIGEQTFLTATSIHTDKPEWKSERTVVLEANGPRIVRVSVHEAHLTGNKLVCYCELDLSGIFDSVSFLCQHLGGTLKHPCTV
jgi:hypothetical protein